MLIRPARTAPGNGAVRAHDRPLRRRVLTTFGAAVAALLCLTLTGAAHAAPVAAAAPGSPVVIIQRGAHQLPHP
ncbi:hypothetical protein [Streptomyces sp. NEAU-S77]|uniref:hypothetical protein n=1 Tax=Streptomyces sp. NEAU-S77 TaxID=3411033 RepID=UPI003BA31B3A